MCIYLFIRKITSKEAIDKFQYHNCFKNKHKTNDYNDSITKGNHVNRVFQFSKIEIIINQFLIWKY